MRAGVATGDGPLGLDAAARDRLSERIGYASAFARRERRPVIASATSPLDPGLDLAAVVLAAQRAEDRVFCFEQPDRDGFALAALGEAASVEASGPGRFTSVAAESRRLASG